MENKFKDQGVRIKKMREENTDLNATEMADKLEIERVRYGHYERGRSEMPTAILKKFCVVSKTTPNYIRFGTKQTIPGSSDVSTIDIIGEVQAGTWREARQWDEEDWETEFFNASAREAGAYGLRVVGDSMDEHYPEGSTVVVLPLHSYPIPIESYDHVVVERCRGGDIYELTIKEIVTDGDKAELWPRSRNPKYKEPVSLFWPYDRLQHHGIETVEIKGVVIASINRRKKF